MQWWLKEYTYVRHKLHLHTSTGPAWQASLRQASFSSREESHAYTAALFKQVASQEAIAQGVGQGACRNWCSTAACLDEPMMASSRSRGSCASSARLSTLDMMSLRVCVCVCRTG